MLLVRPLEGRLPRLAGVVERLLLVRELVDLRQQLVAPAPKLPDLRVEGSKPLVAFALLALGLLGEGRPSRHRPPTRPGRQKTYPPGPAGPPCPSLDGDVGP